MVGSGASDRSKEAVGMMALHEALRSVCLNSDWTYSVFWTIRPRPYVSFISLCPPVDFFFFFFFVFFQMSTNYLHTLFFSFLFDYSLSFCTGLAGELEVAMVVKLGTTMVACEYLNSFYFKINECFA